MSTLDEVMTTEDRLRAIADAGHPETWQPQAAGAELTGKVVRYSRAYTQRGDHVWIMVVESLRTPGRQVSVWLLHTTLRNEVNEQQPRPGETVFLRYDGLQAPKNGGDEYHSWKLVIDRDEAANPTFGFPWQGDQEPRTEADAMTPHSTGPAAQTEEAKPWQEEKAEVVDDIPF